jgi:CO/xanthine dehydrogenase FAD-binding subunit
MLPGFTYVRPLSVAEALRECASDSAVLHAGGTDLLGCLRDGVFSAGKVVALSGLKELRGTRMTRDGGLRIGALSCLAEVAAHPLVTERYAALAQAAASVASPQLRNQGTLGGNLCQRPRFACGKAVTPATPSTVSTSTTASWAGRAATSCIHRTRLRHSLPSGVRSALPLRGALAFSPWNPSL